MSQQSSTSGSNGFTDGAPVPYTFNSKVMAGVIIALFLVVFFILMVHVCARRFLVASSMPYSIRRGIAFVSPNAAASALINTGLDKATIAQLPTFVYKAPSPPVDSSEAGKLDESVAQPSLECAVCLSEFQDNEKGRMLPSCKHTFHIECIDMWLFSHSTCPLCREKVVLGVATSPESASTHAQHQEEEEQEAMEPSPGTTEGNHVVSNAVDEYPCNVLFWGNQTQVVSSQEPSCSSLPLSRSLHMPSARALPQITIDIPPIEGNLLVSASGPLSAKCTTEEEAGPSHLLKSPGFRASIKRMLSRQSSRQKSSSQEGYDESSK